MSRLPVISLFGHRLANCDRTTVLADMLNREQKATYAFVNAHCVNVAANDRDYNAALRAADALLPDGIGIAIAARMSRQTLRENLNGTDLFLPLCEALAAQGKSVFFLGARPGVAEQAARNAQEIVPGLKVAGTRHGFFTASENDDVVSEINAARPDVLLVAMGVPLQDVWLRANRWQIDAKVAMGVGALFDFYAGEVQRAPKALRKAGLEWAWRLAMEPRRMARRYLFGNPAFLMRAVENAWSASPSVPNPMPISKRILDITIASAALFAFSPVLLGTAVAVKAESPGPVFFRQTRVGLNGKTFGMIKFRSMYTDAEARRAELLAQSDRQGVCFKQKNDPRITRVGRFIRRFSIDELPQLLNVLRGEMSLVGPRPALPEEVAVYPPRARKRLESVPGITGIWQVSGRADVAFGRMVAMDLTYGRSRSVLLDLSLLAQTARAVFSARGAY